MRIPSLLTCLAVLLTAPVLLQSESIDVYFGTAGPPARGIYHSRFDTDSGQISPPDLAAEIGTPGFLALHPEGDKLYAVARTLDSRQPVVVGYEIEATGGLTLINHSPITDGAGTHLAVHPSGRFLITAQYGGGSVALFPLDDTGRLGAVTLSRHSGGSGVVDGRQDSPHPHWCGFSPDGEFSLVPDLGLDGIVIYRVDLAGPSIERHGFAASSPGAGPRHLRFSPDGRFIYLLNELSLAVTTFSWEATDGVARQLGTVPALTETAKAGESSNSAAEILVHPSGRFVYSSNRGIDSVTVYRANPQTGELQVIQVQPIRGAWPRHINLAPDGGWLLAAGADSNTVAVHRVDPDTGRLTYQTKGIINVPSPICVLFVNR